LHLSQSKCITSGDAGHFLLQIAFNKCFQQTVADYARLVDSRSVQHELGNVNELPKYIYIKLSSGWQNVSFGLILGLLALLLG